MHFKAFSWAVIWSIHVTMLAPLALAQQTGLKPPLAWSCDNCPDFINPVCADGVTFRHRCIAECQKIMNAQDGACKGDDLLQQARWQGRKAPPDSTTGVEAIMTSSSAAGGAADAAAQQQLLGGSGKTSKSTIDIGTTGAEVTASIMARFHAEGLVYVGSLALHDGPSNNNWTYEQLKTRMGNDLEGQQGSADNGVGSVADQAQVRAIRYSVSDGSFYFEASPRLTDLWTIIPKAARRNLLRKNDDAIPLGATAEAGAAEGVDSPCENGSSTTTTTTTTNTTTATINNDNNHKRTQACTHRGSTNGSVNVTNSAAVAAAVAAAMSPGISSSKDKTNSLDRRIGQHRRALGEEPWRAPQSSSVYPFSALAFIRYPTAKGMNRCTGTFVSPWDVLTAAHCVWDFFDSTGYSDWIIYPGLDNATTLNGRTSLAPEYVTFYRTENMNTTAGKIYSSSSIRNAVNYFDIAVIRLKSPHTSWLGIKYDCARASYPKTLACSYPNDNTGMFASLCVQCFISTSQCRPLWMMYNYCYSRPGSSGMGIMDLNDLRVVGVLSGGEGDDWDYSYSTPIDAFHFNNLVRWIWPSSPPSPNRPPPPPVVVIRPPPPKPSPPAPSLRSTPLVSLSPKKVAQQTSSNSEDVISPNPPNGGGDNIETPAPPHGQSVPPSPHPQPPLQPSQPVSFPDERYLLKKEQQQQGQGDWAAAPPEGDPTNLSQPAFPNGPPVKGGIPPSPGFGVTGIGDGSDQRSGVEDSTQSEASNTNTNSAPSSINIKSTSVSAQLTAAPSPSKPCIDGQLRLMDGWSSWSGRLEICNSSGVWGTICDVGWTWDDARVACRQLGYPAGGEAIQGGLFPGAAASVPMHYGGITCLGSEGMLTKCDFPDSMPRACYSVDKNNNTVVDHKYDAGLMCVPDGSVATPPVSGATNGSNSWQPGDYPCPSDNSLRLAPGTVTSGNRGTGNAGAWISGRLEVCVTGQWGSVCDDSWNNADATVACKQLGYSSGMAIARAAIAIPAVPKVNPGPLNMSIWLSNVDCSGTETSLMSCKRRLPLGRTACTHQEDAGVVCFYTPAPTAPPQPPPPECSEDGALRLVPLTGQPKGAGRLEVCYSGRYGLVCDDTFGLPEARVACRQLGYLYGRPMGPPNSAVAGDPGPGAIVWINDVRCTIFGTELGFWKLIQCRFTGWGESSCNPRTQAVGLMCSNDSALLAPAPPQNPAISKAYNPPPPPSLPAPPLRTGCVIQHAIRVVSASGVAQLALPAIGRVEVCYNNVWGAICTAYDNAGDTWNDRTAFVACRQLAFRNSQIATNAQALDGSSPSVPALAPGGRYWRFGVLCETGNEARLVECSGSGYNASRSCSASVAGVKCS